ncbi:Multicopper oxidase domain containing protein [Elaphomyces granulatus]|jgi:FtsP/CotA-like multicopper oxidase with cupredoxin domain
MLGFERIWTYLLYVFSVGTVSPFDAHGTVQSPLLQDSSQLKDYPIFLPPNAPEGSKFVCQYPELTGYESCGNPKDQGCWLRPKDPKSGLKEYNIHTDYENNYPKGILRKYTLDVTRKTLYPDGCKNDQCKVFNDVYPGPWIRACWGDDIEVTVTNHLDCNGTTIHWHGIRQLNTVENDGVNAVTQCPVAPGDSLTYKFKAMQYGTSWYHSHYSLQYADGMAGPLTIHGPSSANYDLSKEPILMTDWNQRSAFEDWSWTLEHNTRPNMTSILLNGKGKFVPETGDTCQNPQPPEPHTLFFKKGLRYLLRLINTSVDTTFVFSIDGHKLTVIQMDFVPIQPYTNTSVLIGIGQRYHVIVEASPSPEERRGNYWIRTIPADGCSSFKAQYTTQTGIVRYDRLSRVPPTSKQNQFDTKCSDETYSSLKPVVPWTVPNTTLSQNHEFGVELTTTNPPPYYPSNFSRWELHKGPMWLNFGAPTILNLAEDPSTWTAELSVNTTNRDQWVELLISAAEIPDDPTLPVGGQFLPVSHPIHLHGHDFALLAQSEIPYNSSTAVIKRDNPPRRDVALLPSGGYIIIAFKTDNPGVWLIHCHIAWHASSGLAMQVLENVRDISIPTQALQTLQQTCKKWDTWFNDGRLKNCATWHPFQDDSGV